MDSTTNAKNNATSSSAKKNDTRKKIVIQRIEGTRSRQVTFVKRKNGLLKKAMELGILCDCEVTVMVYNLNNGKFFEYSSVPIEDALRWYASYSGPAERRKTDTFFDLAGSKSKVNIPEQEPAAAKAALAAATAAEKRPRPFHKFASPLGEVQNVVVNGKRLSSGETHGNASRRGDVEAVCKGPPTKRLRRTAASDHENAEFRSAVEAATAVAAVAEVAVVGPGAAVGGLSSEAVPISDSAIASATPTYSHGWGASDPLDVAPNTGMADERTHIVCRPVRAGADKRPSDARRRPVASAMAAGAWNEEAKVAEPVAAAMSSSGAVEPLEPVGNLAAFLGLENCRGEVSGSEKLPPGGLPKGGMNIRETRPPESALKATATPCDPRSTQPSCGRQSDPRCLPRAMDTESEPQPQSQPTATGVPPVSADPSCAKLVAGEGVLSTVGVKVHVPPLVLPRMSSTPSSGSVQEGVLLCGAEFLQEAEVTPSGLDVQATTPCSSEDLEDRALLMGLRNVAEASGCGEGSLDAWMLSAESEIPWNGSADVLGVGLPLTPLGSCDGMGSEEGGGWSYDGDGGPFSMRSPVMGGVTPIARDEVGAEEMEWAERLVMDDGWITEVEEQACRRGEQVYSWCFPGACVG